MSDFPKELIPIVVVLWMNLHTGQRRGLLYQAEMEFRSDVDGGVTVTMNENGLICCTWRKTAYQRNCYVHELMPSAPDGVGIADYTAL